MRKPARYCLPLLAALLLAPFATADQNNPKLDELFATLREIERPDGIASLESRIWAIWMDSGDAGINRLMAQGVAAMSARDFDAALAVFDEIVALRPQFAEGWNKRATVYYLRDEPELSLRDVQRTLVLEPRHFGALSGMGLIFISLGDIGKAIDAFEEVLKVHPNSPGAKAYIRRLSSRLKEEAI